MTAISERKNGAVSMSELERRWKNLRTRMADAGIDVLVTQNNNDHMGGSVKYLTDFPATNGYPMGVAFFADEDMVVVRQGPRDGVTELEHEGNGVMRGVRRIVTTPAFMTIHFNGTDDAELLAGEIGRSHGRANIGLIGPAQMSHAFVQHLKDKLPGAKFTDATDLFDQVKAHRSEEELAFAREAAAIQDRAIQAAFDAAEPGMRDSDVAAIAMYHAQREGAEQGITLCASGPACTPMRMGQRHIQNRVLREGDQLALLVETNGPGGQYCEIGRTLILGPVPAQLEDELPFALAARQVIVDGLVDGANPAEVARAYNAYMAANGRPGEKRLVGHGQGYDMVERPLIREDETMRVAKGMNMSVHPTYVYKGAMNFVCDNYVVTGSGAAERLHRLPEKLFGK